MKKIMFITGGMGRGGAERVISILANKLSQRNYEVYILQLLFSDCSYDIDLNVHRIDISKSSRNQILDTPRLIVATRKLVKTLKPDAIFSFMVSINIVSWIATRFLKCNFIAAERNDPSIGRGKILQLLQKIVYANTNMTVFQTRRARDYFSQKIRNNSVIIPNPILVQQKASEEPSKKIVSVGRLEKQKNHKLLIDAFFEIHKSFPEYTLELYGEGSLRDELEKHVYELGITNSVIFHGSVKNIHHQISDAFLFVLSSDFEGQSNALLEAQMMGLPCISTNCSGSDEAIVDGENGLIVTVGNKDELVLAMKRVLSNRVLRDSLAYNASLSCKEYELDSVIEKWEALI